MDRRHFLKDSAVVAAAGLVAPQLIDAKTNTLKTADNEVTSQDKSNLPLIVSAPMLQNYASTSIGIAFAVSDMANGFVKISENSDMSSARVVKCGGYRVTDMNDKVMLVRVTGLKPSTRYYYTIGADRISYGGGYKMAILSTEENPGIYSFVTAGKQTEPHFCVINDTHARFEHFGKTIQKVSQLAPSCVIWNGDASNSSEDIETQIEIFLNPPLTPKEYASQTPYLFCPGNHDSRGLANRHIEKVWMFRQPEERQSRDWDLGRNFAVRMGDIAMIGLDTAEDKVDTNPKFAGLFNSAEYREAQVAWLTDALKRKEIASAPFLVAFCHIPLHDDDPTHNPGDIMPDDYDPQYKHDYACWQRTCSNLWAPLLQKAHCQLVITAHMHCYRYDEPETGRCWGHMVGGGPKPESETRFPTVIDGRVEDGKLKITVYNSATGEIVDVKEFKKR